jgi:hypothetical protein
MGIYQSIQVRIMKIVENEGDRLISTRKRALPRLVDGQRQTEAGEILMGLNLLG